MPVQVLGGKNALAESGGLLRALGNRCLVVTGRQSAKASGALDELDALFARQGISYAVFDEIKPNPLVSDCYRAAARAKAVGAQFVIGIGGGSPLDSAKVVALLATNELSVRELYGLEWPAPPLPSVLIGTTAGTGSEVTMVSVLTQDDTGRKKSVTAPALYARFAVADARYTASCGYGVTLSCALDALCHAVEGYFSARANVLTDAVAVGAVHQLVRAIGRLAAEEAYRAGGAAIPIELREELYSASLMAGMVLNGCGAGFPHAMGYILTEDFGVPHGMACAAFLPAYIQRAYRCAPAKALALGVRTERLAELVEACLDLPPLVLTAEQIEGYLPRFDGNKNFRNSPGEPGAEDARAILTARFGDRYGEDREDEDIDAATD